MVAAIENRIGVDEEKRMRDFAASLNEKDRRRFAAFEAMQRGHGGIAYVAEVIGCSRRKRRI